MNELLINPLTALVEGRMHESIAAGADVHELAAIAVDAVIAEAIALLEVRAAALREPYAKLIVQDCAERILAAQFGGYVPAPARR